MKGTHKYDYKISLGDPNTAAYKVLQMVGQNKKVLDVGAGPGSIAKLLKHHASCKVFGVENDPSAIKQLTSHCEKIFQLDLNSTSWTSEIQSEFDVIVAADVLEHLYNPWQILSDFKQLISKNGHVVISLPHAAHSAVMASLYNGNFRYHEYGLLDKTHIRFFGIKNIQDLITESGYQILDASFVVIDPQYSELSDLWEATPRLVRKYISSHKHSRVCQVVLKVAPTVSFRTSLKLADLKVPRSQSGLANRIYNKLKKIYLKKGQLNESF